jgi:hypothetical protein
MKQEITVTILVEVPETKPASERSYLYNSQSKGLVRVCDMHPHWMFNALRKAMNTFGPDVILGCGVYQEMFRRLSEVEGTEEN